MKDFVTVTSKGQVTLPAKMRKALGISKPGQKLQIQLDAQSNRLELRKPVELRDIQSLVRKHAKNPEAPVPENIHEWYAEQRTADLTSGESK